MSPGRRRWLALALAGTLALTGCTATDSGQGDDRADAAAPRTSSAEPSPASTPTATPEPPHPVSLPALMAAEYDGRALRVGSVLARTSAYTRHAVTYRSGDLKISGIMNVPDGRGPFPVLILNHGYIDPAVYTTGRGLMREQDYLARAGYVVLHTDYRNHAGSDDDPRSEVELRLGYTADVINSVLAVKRSRLPYLDGERVGLLGRSLGGGVTFNALVVRPGIVDAAVVFAPVSADAQDNFNRWTRGEPDRAGLTRRIIRAYGSPESAPAFWRAASASAYFDRVSEPVLIHHGTADESCPLRWSRETLAELRAAGKDARLVVYPGEPHAFIAEWPASMRRTVAFFDKHLEVRG
ncbi:MAG: alpha/beta hydrolase family protein [Actinomycetes bacterium]